MATCLLCLENGYLWLESWNTSSSRGVHQYYASAARVGTGVGFTSGDVIGVEIDRGSQTLAFDLNGHTPFGLAARLPALPFPESSRGGQVQSGNADRTGDGTICFRVAVELGEPGQKVELE